VNAIHEYAGFRYELRDGHMVPLPGQHKAAYKEKHRMAALEDYKMTSNEDIPPWEGEPEQASPVPYTPGQIRTSAEAKAFVLAGRATLTLVSKKTGVRFTFEVSTPPDDPSRGKPGPVGWFVNLLVGSDNEQSYKYIGHIYKKDLNYVAGQKAKVHAGAPGPMAFTWFYTRVVQMGQSPEEAHLEVWHEGKCGKCGRKLTVPESIERGIGPECYSKMGGRATRGEL
jgi:hypothetical protein